MEWNEVIGLLPALFVGVVLGVIFFGGLWFTVRKGLDSKNSGLIFIVSFIIRMAVVLSGFYFVGAGDWRKMMVCLGGFLIARIVITQFTKRDASAKNTFIKTKQ